MRVGLEGGRGNQIFSVLKEGGAALGMGPGGEKVGVLLNTEKRG